MDMVEWMGRRGLMKTITITNYDGGAVMDIDVLRVALAKLNLPQIALARQLGVDHGTFSRWKRGWYPVPERFRGRLASILGVDEIQLFPPTREGQS